MKDTNKWFGHALGIIAFLFLPIFLYPQPPEAQNLLLAQPTIRDFIGNAMMLGFFYANYYFFIPTFYLSQKYTLYFVILAVFLVLICWLPSFFTGHDIFNGSMPKSIPSVENDHFMGENMPPRPLGNSFLEEIKHHIFVYGLVVLFSVLLHTRNRLFKTENDKLQAELSNLKAQIHPHFLFNTLNSIYALAIRKDDKAPDTIVKLAEFMRYLLKDSSQDLVALDKEISYIENYIDLQKSRLRNSVQLSYHIIGSFEGHQIAPLLLFIYIENAFKHGVNPDENSVISILIEVIETTLTLTVVNNIVTANNKESSLNIGLYNTQERLKMIYPNKHKLLITHTKEEYRVKLEIAL